MAHHKSAQKHIRQTRKRKARNQAVKSSARTAVKKVATAIDEGDKEKALAALREAEGTLARSAAKGVLPRRRAARKTSRMARKISSLG